MISPFIYLFPRPSDETHVRCGTFAHEVVLTGFYGKNAGKEEETGGDRAEAGGGPRPSRGGLQSQEGEEGLHDSRQEEEAQGE